MAHISEYNAFDYACPLKLYHTSHHPQLTLVEELQDQADSQQPNLHAVKQMQTKYLCCLNCYLSCKSFDEELFAHEAEEELQAWAITEETK